MNQQLEEQFEAIDNYWKAEDRIYDRVSKKLGITKPSLFIFLFLLRKKENITQNQIIDYWLYPKQTVSFTLHRRMMDGRIESNFVNGSKKAKGIFLTQKGKTYCNEKILPIMEAEDKAFSSLSEEERKAFVEITKKHVALLREYMDKIK